MNKTFESLCFLAVVFLVLVAASIVLTPRQWEPGNENWIRWAAARVFQENGELPRYSTGPLYVIYLLPFSAFSYPFSLTLEYILTHLFLYLALYAFLQRFMRRRYALLLTIAWIPTLATIEPGNNLLGLAFLCLYLIPGRSVFRNEGYFPPALLAAALSHPVYGTFLLGHSIGTFFERRYAYASSHQVQLQPSPGFSKEFLTGKPIGKRYVAKFLSLILLLFLFLIVTASPARPEYNHIFLDPVYAPVALESPGDAFFQNGAERYVRRAYPQEEWVYQDWYFSVPEAYGGATTIWEAIIQKPEIVFRNFLTNMGTGVQLPGFFFSGVFLGPVSLFFFIFIFFGGIGLVYRIKEDKHYSLLFSLLLGTASALLILALTTFNAVRYVSTLLPVGLLLLVYVSSGFTYFTKYWLQKNCILKGGGLDQARFPVKILGLGLLSLLAGVLLNGKVINSVIFPNRLLPASILQQIFIFDVILVVIGIAFLLFSRQLSVFVQKKKELLCQRKEYLMLFLEKITATGQGTKYLAVFSVLLLFLSVPAQYPAGIRQQMQSVAAGEDFLSGQKPVSMADSYPQLRQYLQRDKEVLAREYTWIMAFTEVQLDNIHQIWSLPPFKDPTKKTEENLENLDVILVSYWLESDRPGLGMQSYPRYIFHLEPFLENSASGAAENRSEKKIDNYGSIYVKES